MKAAHGSVFKYGDNVDTDVIIPARYLNSSDPKELATHCMEDIDKDFVKNVHVGDIIVANKNFGCGSSREHAPISIKASGVSCVIAETFARIFYRNAINIKKAYRALDRIHGIDDHFLVDTDLISDFCNGIIAETFARIFYRNAINIGLPIIECPQAAKEIQAGDEVEVDFDSGIITDVTTGKKFQGQAFPPFMQKIIDCEGLVNYINQK